MNFKLDYKKVSIAISLAAFNLIIGSIVSFFKLPVYLDTIGMVVSTILLGWQYGLLCGFITLIGGFFLINPYYPFYAMNMISIVLITELLRKFNMFSNIVKTVISGLIIAVIAAIVSAPITAYLFEGSTLSGNDAITAYFVSTGNNILNSVLFSGFASEPVDKIIVVVISFLIFKSIPKSFYDPNNLRYYKDNS
jgi:energy-coupling factor transport system substrate-specific component